jgi:hypothetical protein
MLVRPREVYFVIALVVSLIACKHVPAFEAVPWAHITGILCFAFAIYLALRIYVAELARIRSE